MAVALIGLASIIGDGEASPAGVVAAGVLHGGIGCSLTANVPNGGRGKVAVGTDAKLTWVVWLPPLN